MFIKELLKVDKASSAGKEDSPGEMRTPVKTSVTVLGLAL